MDKKKYIAPIVEEIKIANNTCLLSGSPYSVTSSSLGIGYEGEAEENVEGD